MHREKLLWKSPKAEPIFSNLFKPSLYKGMAFFEVYTTFPEPLSQKKIKKNQKKLPLSGNKLEEKEIK